MVNDLLEELHLVDEQIKNEITNSYDQKIEENRGIRK